MGQIFGVRLRKLAVVFLLGLSLSLTWLVIVFASSPGDLDISFNGTGVVTTSINSLIDGGFAVAIQPDNKIVVAGTCDDIENFAVLRYNSDGSLDTDFNGTGIVTTSVGNGYEELGLSVVLQPDQKIVVAGAGTRTGMSNDLAVVRYNQDGSLDTDFNGTGIVTTPLTVDSSGRSVALQADGKLVVAGDTWGPVWEPENTFVVVRYNQDGSLDTDFKGTGIVTTSIGEADSGRAVLVQPDGKIVVAGRSSYQFAVLRYTTAGELDTDFNGTGIVTTPVGTNSEGMSAAIQGDGKIVVAGLSETGGNHDFAIVRYNSNGSLDTTFNGAGIVTTDISAGFDEAHTIAIQPNRKIVVAGVSNFGMSTGDFTIVRYNSDGNLDTTFGNGGIITTTISNNRDEARGIGIQSDGKIVAVGFENVDAFGGTDVNVAVARYIGDRYTYLPIILK
jgi:uncharacterized delta-60 repeat protein